MNKIIIIAVIISIIIGIAAYKAYQNSSTENIQASIPQIQNSINSTIPEPVNNNVHKVIHITLNDGMGVKSP